jgi:threonine dehydrogenase-like Zn-dependent dehydrogenase
MDLEEIALLEPFATGLHAVEISDLKAGDACVVEGPGPTLIVDHTGFSTKPR